MNRRIALVVLSALSISLGGCSDMKGLSFGKSKSKAATSPSTAKAEPTADPHQEETVAQVLEFVDRLDSKAPVPAQGDEAEGIALADSTDRSLAANMTANEAVDLKTDSVPPQAQAEPLVALPDMPVIEAVVIRGTALDQPADAQAQLTSSANLPLTTALPEQDYSVEELIAALKEHLTKTPSDTPMQWKLMLLQLASGLEEDARSFSDGMLDGNRQLMSRLVDVIVTTQQMEQNSVVGAGDALTSTQALLEALTDRSDLQIPTVALCTRVETFGVYEEMAPGALVPNQANRVIVYVEVANFFSEEAGDVRYRTVLSGDMEVLTADGRSLWRHEEPDIIDTTRTRRRDFFLAQLVTLPANLGSGEFVLKVTIQDEVSGKSNQALHPFTIGSAAVATMRP